VQSENNKEAEARGRERETFALSGMSLSTLEYTLDIAFLESLAISIQMQGTCRGGRRRSLERAAEFGCRAFHVEAYLFVWAGTFLSRTSRRRKISKDGTRAHGKRYLLFSPFHVPCHRPMIHRGPPFHSNVDGWITLCLCKRYHCQ